MREHSPFDRSPISRERTRTRSQDVEQSITETPTSRTATESPSVVAEHIENAQRNAEQIATDLEQAQTEPVSAEPAALPIIKPSLTDRMRNFFGIPKSISAEVRELDESDVQAVETYNADETQSPKIIRKPNTLSRALLLSTALGAIGMTHEPQIERATQIGIEAAKELEKTTEVALKKFTDDVIAFIARNKPFGKEAYAGEFNETGDGSEEGAGGEVRSYTKTQKEKLEKFSKGKGGQLSKEQEGRAVELIERIEKEYVSYADFFLEMELIHGQITQEQYDEAQTELYKISREVGEKLTEKERESSIRVAFELAKHRTTYAREKADLHSITMTGEGNCEALVRFLLAEIPNVAYNRPEMAVQVFTDHVRLLVREKNDQPWQWIDGQSHGVLTKEEMQGTLIMDPQVMMRESVGLTDRVQKNKAGDPIPEKNMGYTTNSMIRWETVDGRTPMRASSPDGNIPLRVDESKNKNKTFEQGAHAPREEHTRYVEVSPDFFSNEMMEEEQKKDAQEAEIKEVRLAPPEKDLAYMLQTGRLYGSYNDLAPLEGINLNSVELQDPKRFNEQAATDVDLSPLKDSNLTNLTISMFLRVKGVDGLNVKQIRTADLSAMHEALWKKIIKESESLQELELYVPVIDTQNHAQLIKTGKILRMPGFEDIIKKLQKQKSGKFTLRTPYPFEKHAGMLEWVFDGTIESWSKNTEQLDYLSTDTRESINQNKRNPDELVIPSSVSSMEYLHQEQTDLGKLKRISIEQPDMEVTSGHEGEDRLSLDLSVLHEAKKLETIHLVIPDVTTSTLNLSELDGLSFRELIIETDMDPNDFTIEGLDQKIRISIKERLK